VKRRAESSVFSTSFLRVEPILWRTAAIFIDCVTPYKLTDCGEMTSLNNGGKRRVDMQMTHSKVALVSVIALLAENYALAAEPIGQGGNRAGS